jgi:hypothetical protein
MKSEVSAGMKIHVALWIVKTLDLVRGHGRCEGMYCLQLHRRTVLLCGGSMFILNVSHGLPD